MFSWIRFLETHWFLDEEFMTYISLTRFDSTKTHLQISDFGVLVGKLGMSTFFHQGLRAHSFPSSMLN